MDAPDYIRGPVDEKAAKEALLERARTESAGKTLAEHTADYFNGHLDDKAICNDAGLMVHFFHNAVCKGGMITHPFDNTTLPPQTALGARKKPRLTVAEPTPDKRDDDGRATAMPAARVAVISGDPKPVVPSRLTGAAARARDALPPPPPAADATPVTYSTVRNVNERAVAKVSLALRSIPKRCRSCSDQMRPCAACRELMFDAEFSVRDTAINYVGFLLKMEAILPNATGEQLREVRRSAAEGLAMFMNEWRKCKELIDGGGSMIGY